VASCVPAVASLETTGGIITAAEAGPTTLAAPQRTSPSDRSSGNTRTDPPRRSFRTSRRARRIPEEEPAGPKAHRAISPAPAPPARETAATTGATASFAPGLLRMPIIRRGPIPLPEPYGYAL